MGTYSIGLDYGTNSVRALLVDTRTGEEVAGASFDYPSGKDGIVLSDSQPDLARQNPADYAAGAEATILQVLKDAEKLRGIGPGEVIGIGVDATGSTPIPLDAEGIALGLRAGFRDNAAAGAWLWKDHTAHGEAGEITELARRIRPGYLAKCGGVYSSEWFWAKILHCARESPGVFAAAATWVEQSDYIPALLTGAGVKDIRRNICAAGHKAMANVAWGGYPDGEFLRQLDPRLAELRASLPERFYTIADAAGGLSAEWAKRTGLADGTPVAVGAIDAHVGAVGAGIEPGVLVKIIGTSTCDLMTAAMDGGLGDIPGLCGIVPGSILPGAYGLEAGQSAVGDIFNWFTQTIAPGGKEEGSHASLSARAGLLRPGESGLLALDWHNGNRTVLIDQRLTGMIVGLTLRTTPAEIYRALIEATAFGARIIMERFEEYGVKVKRVVNAGGIAAKNPLAMQIYADVMKRPIEIARSAQTCAVGAAIAGAVAAGTARGGHATVGAAVAAMTAQPVRTFTPDAGRAAVYERLYGIYRAMHDAFGIRGQAGPVGEVMKELLILRDGARG